MKKFLQEFMSFALKGNVLDLAVGVIIGATFQGMVKSLTDDIISPVLGLFTGQNFDTLQLEFSGLIGTEEVVVIRYGAFITAIINFFIMALIVFLLVRSINRIYTMTHKPKPAAEPTTQKCPYCQSDISLKATRCPHCTSQLTAEAAQ